MIELVSYLQFSRIVRDLERSGVHVPLPNRTLSLLGMNFGYNWPQFYSKDSFWLAQTIQHNPILLTLSQNKRHDLIWSNQNEARPELCSRKRKEKLSDSRVLSDGRSDRLIVLHHLMVMRETSCRTKPTTRLREFRET